MESIFDSQFLSSSSSIVVVRPPDLFRAATSWPANGSFSTLAHENRKQKSCPRGKILRKGYTTKRGTRVKPTCITDRGLKGKGPKLIPPVKKPGFLRSFGYSTSKSALARRRALTKAIKFNATATGRSRSNLKDVRRAKAVATMRRLIQIRNLSYRINPKAASILQQDYKWIKKRYL